MNEVYRTITGRPNEPLQPTSGSDAASSFEMTVCAARG